MGLKNQLVQNFKTWENIKKLFYNIFILIQKHYS